MKKLKDTEEIIKINKNNLNEYLSDFEPSIRNRYLNLFNDKDFETGISSFLQKMKRKIKMPKIGKQTTKYWTSRGWSMSKVEELRSKIKKDPITSPMNVEHWMNKGYSKEDSLFKVRSQRKMNIEYWINKGYSNEDAQIEVVKYQKRSNKKFLLRYNTDSEFKRMVDSKKSNTIDYWINKGYNQEDSKKMQSNRQRTFSKDICIEKYGLEDGMRIWQERQNKWTISLKNSDYDLVSGKSFTINDRIEKYNIDELIDSLTIKDKEIFRGIFKNSNTIEEFINNYASLYNMDEISLYRLLLPLKRMKLLKSYYNTTESYIMSLIIPKLTRIKTKYSYITWFNNHICRSDGEYIIANFLFENDIDYIYEKQYNNSKYRCDFYLKEYNIYVEYLGMKIKSYESKLNFLNENNIKHIASDDIEYIKNEIKKYANIKNR